MAKDFARTERVAEQILRELAQMIRLAVKDPRVRKVTLTGVEVTNDYAHAKVFFTSLEGDTEGLQQGLERAAGFLRSQLAHAMKLRITPQLHFVYDASIERGAHLSQLIDQAVSADKKNDSHDA
ncbi:30S ribosome-binding factor RbfA [Ferrigenium sp. UT5]|uniref:30S ribosome-binding factor RbfA n=1 Tax=Ferrigenium sp. UT5 TaxID=3242105 RepID=UPI0035546783